jgi:hypothetical protein
VISRHTDHAATYVLEESSPCFLRRAYRPFEDARPSKRDQIGSEIDRRIVGESRLFLYVAGKSLHKVATEAQPNFVDVLDLFLAATAFGHDPRPSDALPS